MYFLNCKEGFGWIEIITGCMFAGKTEEFIRRIVRLQYGNYRIQIFKPQIDNRYDALSVVSHCQKKLTAQPVNDSGELMTKVLAETQVVGIDEVQFFDENIVKIVNDLANQGKLVIVNGLDKDFRGEPFLNVERLMALAEEVEKLHAICVKCGKLANFTQRLINGQPAKYNDPIIVIGESDKYEARCRQCHQINKK